jgi:hypothetical protein
MQRALFALRATRMRSSDRRVELVASAHVTAGVALAEALDATLLTADARSTGAPGLRCEVELLQ